jgi:hypothetical protein
MDWSNILQDTTLIAGVSTAIFVVLDLIKRIYYKLPWRWVQKTPGEVWFVLSIAFGLLVALFVLWPALVSGEGSIVDKATTAIYGVVFGAGSKLMNAIFSSGGAKLKASKLEAQTKIETPAPKIENATVNDVTYNEPINVEAPLLIEEPEKEEDFVKLVKLVPIDADYAIIGNEIYPIEKGEK